MLHEITIGVAQKLREAFGDAYEIHIDGNAQDFTKPCFFILCLRVEQGKLAGNRYCRTHSFDVRYFPASESAREVSETVDRLFAELECVQVNEATVRAAKMAAEAKEDALHFFVNYDVFLLKQREPVPYMGKLEQGQQIKA